MFHPPTFYHRLFLDRVSPLLLDIIYALSSRFSEDPGLLSTLPADTSVHARGEVFAERANHCARHMVEQRAGWSEEEKRLDRGTWEETEFAQALCLLSVYFMHLRGSSGNGASVGSFYLDEGINVLRPTSSATLSPPASHLGLSIVEYLTLMEARYRTFWMLVAQDLCASADGHGRKRRVSEHEMYNIPLPGGEAHWVRSGGAAMGGRETRRRDGMAVGTGNWMGEEGQIGEFGQVLRIVSYNLIGSELS